MEFLALCLLTLWLYLPGFLANTFAMMWGKWLPKTGYGPWPIDGGRVMADGNRMLGDGKTWNGLIGGSLTCAMRGGPRLLPAPQAAALAGFGAPPDSMRR